MTEINTPSVAEALATIRGETPEVPAAAVVEEAPPAMELVETPVAAEDLGPYVARLMADARQAAEDYRRDTEREVAERAAAEFAKATADAEEIRSRAHIEAEGIVASARTRVAALSERVMVMSDELKLEASALLAPAAAVAVPADDAESTEQSEPEA